MKAFDTRRARNRGHRESMLQTGLLLVGMAGILGTVAWLVGGATGIVIAIAGTIGLGVGMPALPPHAVMRLYGASVLPPYTAPALYRMVGDLADRAGLAAVPTLYFLRAPAANAFTVGNTRQAAIAVTDGLLRHLEEREVRAVLAHEIAHLAAGDIDLMRLTDVLATATRLIGTFGLVVCLFAILAAGPEAVPAWAIWTLALAPIALALMQLALSRSREFAADMSAVELTGDPVALAQALVRIQRLTEWTFRRMFGTTTGLDAPSLLRTHPPTGERVARLFQHAEELGHRRRGWSPPR